MIQFYSRKLTQLPPIQLTISPAKTQVKFISKTKATSKPFESHIIPAFISEQTAHTSNGCSLDTSGGTEGEKLGHKAFKVVVYMER